MAPAVADVFVAWIESAVLAGCPWIVDGGCWKGFIGDISVLWFHGGGGGGGRLGLFLRWMGGLRPAIGFTANYGRCGISCLDVGLGIDDSRLSTDLCVRPADADVRLPFRGCRPRRCARSVPCGRCLRVRRVCSGDSTFVERAGELEERLGGRGCPERLMKRAVQEMAAVPGQDALRCREGRGADKVPVMVARRPGGPPLSQWLRECVPILHCGTGVRGGGGSGAARCRRGRLRECTWRSCARQAAGGGRKLWSTAAAAESFAWAAAAEGDAGAAAAV